MLAIGATSRRRAWSSPSTAQEPSPSMGEGWVGVMPPDSRRTAIAALPTGRPPAAPPDEFPQNREFFKFYQGIFPTGWSQARSVLVCHIGNICRNANLSRTNREFWSSQEGRGMTMQHIGGPDDRRSARADVRLHLARRRVARAARRSRGRGRPRLGIGGTPWRRRGRASISRSPGATSARPPA